MGTVFLGTFSSFRGTYDRSVFCLGVFPPVSTQPFYSPQLPLACVTNCPFFRLPLAFALLTYLPLVFILINTKMVPGLLLVSGADNLFVCHFRFLSSSCGLLSPCSFASVRFFSDCCSFSLRVSMGTSPLEKVLPFSAPPWMTFFCFLFPGFLPFVSVSGMQCFLSFHKHFLLYDYAVFPTLV